MIAWGIPADDLFQRAEALAKQRRQLLDAAAGVGSKRAPKLRRDARAVEQIIVTLGELAEAACRRERRWGAA